MFLELSTPFVLHNICCILWCEFICFIFGYQYEYSSNVHMHDEGGIFILQYLIIWVETSMWSSDDKKSWECDQFYDEAHLIKNL